MRSHTNLGENFFLSFRRQDRDNEKEEFRRRTFIVQPAFKYKYLISKFKNSNVSSDLQSPQEIFSREGGSLFPALFDIFWGGQ